MPGCTSRWLPLPALEGEKKRSNQPLDTKRRDRKSLRLSRLGKLQSTKYSVIKLHAGNNAANEQREWRHVDNYLVQYIYHVSISDPSKDAFTEVCLRARVSHLKFTALLFSLWPSISLSIQIRRYAMSKYLNYHSAKHRSLLFQYSTYLARNTPLFTRLYD